MLSTQISCHIGSTVVDPLLTIADLPPKEVVSFKIAPLLGGGKGGQMEALKTRIKTCMEEHGVGKDASADRMLSFTAKADLEALAKVQSDDDGSLWKAIKDEANRIRFRLVYRNEQQSAKKDARSKPPSKAAKSSGKGASKAKEFVASATNIKIDMAYFTCDGEAVELIDSSRFGPDQKGLAIMTFSEAERHSQASVSSMDPLAILLVGQKFGPADEIFSMPAFTNQGVPIVIKAALRQYGDSDVSFRAIVPTVKVAETATTVLEIHIYRSEVAQWKECAVPLHYLGVHCSAVRGNNLLATWAMKTFSHERKPVPFQNADYWHGFVRVQDNLLEQILVRSGFSGIYISPKSAEKRHDDRFTVVTLPNGSLAEVQKRATACDKALGIVKVRDQLAIRCKREHAASMRATLVPEAAFVATDAVHHDEQLWVIKQVPSEIGKEGLEQALSMASWNAHPVRAQGLNRWIVASAVQPSSHHLIINGTFVLVEPLKRGPEPAVTIVAKQVKVDTLATDGSMQVATTSRFQEVKADLSEHFESKLALANSRIEQLAAQLENVQSEQAIAASATQKELAQVRDEQAFARQKIGEVESSVINSSQAVVNQMQQMMNQMQASLQLNLEKSMKQMMPGHAEEKRPRRDETPKNDQFSTHGWRSRQGRHAWGLSNACHQLILCICSVLMCNVGFANAYKDNSNYPFGSSCNSFCGYPDALIIPEVSMLGSSNPTESQLLTDELVALLQSVPSRFGEADNPGPLQIGTFNPAQLKGHESTVAAWGSGIWGASETSHTAAAVPLSSKAFRDHGLNTVWSNPVAGLNNTIGSLRGKASGTAVISDFPMARFPIPVPADVDATSRLVESIVHLGNGVQMFVASVYGPAYGRTHIDPWTMLSRVCEVAFEHANAFKGPAVVMGDFNVDCDDVPHWQAMLSEGWADAGLLDATRRGTTPSFTSKCAARKSFIFICPQLVPALQHCDICEEFTFDTHPLLCAKFNIEVIKQPRRIWSLPRSTDDLLFDDDVLTQTAIDEVERRRFKFDRAIDADDPEEALRQINVAFENACAAACINDDGQKTRFPRSCFGRGRKSVVQTLPPSAPTIKRARHDQYTPDICQPDVHIRRLTKQIRRLQCLQSQLAACLRTSDSVSPQCGQLWSAILDAEGFHGGFQSFSLSSLKCFVPGDCPNVQFVRFLTQTFKLYVENEVKLYKQREYEKRKGRTLQDFAKGGKLTFAAVKDSQVLPFQTIANTIQIELPRQKWSKEGKRRILTRGRCSSIDPMLPVTFQGQHAKVAAIRDNCIDLDRCVQLKSGFPLHLTQVQMHCETQKVQQLTCQAWSQMWNREPADDVMGNWDHIADRLTCLGDCPTLDFQPLEVATWKHHAKAVKKGSARGSCGYTPRELLKMPDCLTALLLQLLSMIENAVIQWPPSLMWARVVMLAKSDQPPQNPLQTRPITIISRLYRTWSRYRSFQIIAHIQAQLPPAIAGTAKGVSSEMLAAHVLCEVENAHQSNHAKLGVTVDLVKCFNRIPRRPVLAALAKMGVPQAYLTALNAMFQQLSRFLEIGGQIGEPQTSTSGVPEGCCFSIVCMLALTAWTSAIIEAASDTTACVAYADNWELIADSYNALVDALTAMIRFVDDLHVEIASDKSWVWATHAPERKLLREVSILGRSFPLKHVSTDLGCDVSYGRCITKLTTKKRIAKAKRVLARVGKKQWPKKVKCSVAKQLAPAIISYGSELTFYSKTDFKGTRAACCRAVCRSRGGANPHLALFAPGDAVDPQLILAIRKCMFWRRYFQRFPVHREPFLERVANPTSRLRAGPALVFRRTMADLGWKCHEGGVMTHNQGWCINWLLCSRRFLRKMLEKSWNLHVSEVAASRKKFDIPLIDVSIVRKTVEKLEDMQRGDFINFLIGKHVTNDALVHYSKGATSNKCPLCDEVDSRSHRIHHCTGLCDIRNKYPDVLTWLQTKAEAVGEYALLPYGLEKVDARFSHDPVPIDVPVPDWHQHDPHVQHCIYTDGSADFNHDFVLTVASGAYVCVQDGKVSSTVSEMVPGYDHSSYRGEIWALLLALRDFVFATIHTDSAAVCSVANYLIKCRISGECPSFRDHHDLWNCVWRMLLTRPKDAVRVLKVKAHLGVSCALDPVTHQHTIWNDKADAAAKQCIKTFLKGKKRVLTQACASRDADGCLHLRFANMWCEMTAKCREVVRREQPVNRSLMPVFHVSFYVLNAITCVCKVPKHVLAECPLGPVFAERVRQYFDGLRWDLSQEPIGLLHLYFDFCLHTKTMAPVSVPNASGVEEFLLADQSIAADALRPALVVQSRTWNKMIKWLLKVWGNPPFALIPKAKSLSRYGYPFGAVSLSGSPDLRAKDASMQHLWNYFHVNGAVASSLSRSWQPRVPITAAQAGAWPALLCICPDGSRPSVYRSSLGRSSFSFIIG